MRLTAVLCIGFAIGGCAVASKFKIDHNGMYRFKSEPIVVRAPSECELDISVRDTPTTVDFSTGEGYWMASGQYALQVFTFDQLSIGAKHSFQEVAKPMIEKYIVSDRLPAKFVLQGSKQVDVGGQPGYQATAVEEGIATFVATVVLQPSRVTVSSLIFPIEKTNDQIKRAFPWDCYNRFVESVKEVH
jgi:hypothetical protein